MTETPQVHQLQLEAMASSKAQVGAVPGVDIGLPGGEKAAGPPPPHRMLCERLKILGL